MQLGHLFDIDRLYHRETHELLQRTEPGFLGFTV